MKNFKTKDMVLCAMFVVLIIVGTFIKIPIPMLPITLQVMFTTLAGLLLGGKRGFISVAVYILLGLLGIPVFTQGGGIAYVLQPSFGYIIGFAVGAYVTGTIARKVPNPSYKRLFAASFVGLAIIYAFGMIYFYLITTLYLDKTLGLWQLLMYCFIPVIPGDIVTNILGVVLAKRLIPVIDKE